MSVVVPQGDGDSFRGLVSPPFSASWVVVVETTLAYRLRHIGGTVIETMSSKMTVNLDYLIRHQYARAEATTRTPSTRWLQIVAFGRCDEP